MRVQPVQKFICHSGERRVQEMGTVILVCKHWMCLQNGRQFTSITAASYNAHRLMWTKLIVQEVINSFLRSDCNENWCFRCGFDGEGSGQRFDDVSRRGKGGSGRC